MGRAPCCDKANVKKGPWSPEEDAKLKHFIQTNGTGGNWITLPSKAGLKRCGKSCRLRWINYLRPDIKHGSFTEDEEKTIIDFHGKVGSRWSLIAAQLPGRTDNDIKNYWNTRLKKKLAEKGINTPLGHQQQRAYMRSAAVPLFQSGHLSQGAAMRQPQMNRDLLMDHHQTAQYVEQQRQRNYASVQNAVSAALFHQGQHLDQWQQPKQEPLVTVKNEFVNDLQLPSDMTAVLNDTQRVSTFPMSEEEIKVRKLESELLSDLIPQVIPELSNAFTSTLILNQSVDGMHHQSPTSDCSNWSSDRSFGGQLDESPYGENFGICNSYGDPPPLVDAHKYLLANGRCGGQLDESPFGDNFSIGNSYGDPSALLDTTQRALFSSGRYTPGPWEISSVGFV